MSFRCENAILKRKLYVVFFSPVVQTRTKVSAKMRYLTQRSPDFSNVACCIKEKHEWNMSKLSYEGIWENGGMASRILDLDICLCWFNLSENIPVIHCIGVGMGGYSVSTF